MAKHLTTTAKIPHRWKYEHDQVGYNYRLPNLNAALGCAQMEQLPAFLDSKRRLATKYREALEGLDGARFVQEPPDCVSNYWLCTLLLQPGREQELDQILEATNAAGIMTRPVWALLSSLPMYRDCPRMNLECAASLERRLINVPSSPALCL
jgi:perosamine synthetase